MCYCLQFDEEFSARQEAQAELQKQEEKIKGLEAQINTLQAQVTTRPLYHKFFLFYQLFLKKPLAVLEAPVVCPTQLFLTLSPRVSNTDYSSRKIPPPVSHTFTFNMHSLALLALIIPRKGLVLCFLTLRSFKSSETLLIFPHESILEEHAEEVLSSAVLFWRLL